MILFSNRKKNKLYTLTLLPFNPFVWDFSKLVIPHLYLISIFVLNLLCSQLVKHSSELKYVRIKNVTAYYLINSSMLYFNVILARVS